VPALANVPGHLVRQRLGSAMAQRQRRGQEKNQQAQAEPQAEHQRLVGVETFVELGSAIHAQRPGLAVQLQLLQLAEARTAGLGGFARCVEQVFRLFTGAGVDMQRQRQVGRTQNAAHQIFDAIRAVDEAAQRLHALLRCR